MLNSSLESICGTPVAKQCPNEIDVQKIFMIAMTSFSALLLPSVRRPFFLKETGKIKETADGVEKNKGVDK